MGDSKNTSLSITIRTVDAATAKIKAINAELDRVNKPVGDLKKALGGLAEKSGLNDVISGFKGVGSAVVDVLGKVAMVGGVVAVAVGGLIHLVDGFDDLGKKAQRLGVGVDFLAQMRDSATRAGAPVEALDAGMEAFSVNLGKARAGAGRMAAFLPKISTNLHSDFGATLLTQLKGAKDNAAALNVLADAMSRLKDPAERAALAQMTVGDKDLAPLLAQGSKALKAQGVEYTKHAGSQAEAAKAAAGTHDAMLNLKASMDGVKASLVTGLSPALTKIIDQITAWLDGHQSEVKQWVADIGEKLPGAFNTLVLGVKDAISWVVKIVDRIGGWKNAALGIAAVMAGPLIAAVVALATALAANPMFLELSATVGVVYELAKAFGLIGDKVNKISSPEVLTSAGGGGSLIGPMNGLLGAKPSTMTAAERARAYAEMSPLKAIGGGLMAPGSFGSLFGADPDLKFFQRDDITPQVNAARAVNAGGSGGGSAADDGGANAPQKSTLNININGAPPGLRATVDPKSDHHIDLSVGYGYGVLAP